MMERKARTTLEEELNVDAKDEEKSGRHLDVFKHNDRLCWV